MIITNAAQRYAWRPLRQLQSIFVVLLLGFMPLGYLVTSGSGTDVFIFAALYGGLVLFVEHQIVNWKCPHCKQPFLRRKGTGFALPFRMRCGNCGITFGGKHHDAEI